LIDYIGPLLIVLGPICITLGANLERFLPPPDTEVDDIKEVEKDHISMTLSRIFKTAKVDVFDDPFWVESFQKYYHKNIKELRDAERYLRSISADVRQAKIWVAIVGITFLVVGTTYTASVNLEIIENPEKLILITDVSLIFFLLSELLLLLKCLWRYYHDRQKVAEILQSQQLLLTGMFVHGSGGTG
jgi:hypothetical protein